LNGPLIGDEPALPELAANGRDDRNGEIGCASKGSYRNRLEPRHTRHDRFDTARSLGQSYRVRDLCGDDVRQRHGGRM
jgi:hypothetical protein